jgi:hypothetical protein
MVPRQQDSAFAAELKAMQNLRWPATIVPFVGAGIGLYRASFDTTKAIPPSFYARRMTPSELGKQTTFTDPSFVVETGINIFPEQHLSIRPGLSVRLVTRDSNTYAVTTVGVNMAYHFEARRLGR